MLRTLAFAAAMLTASSALAANGHWANVGAWEIRGDTENGSCYAAVSFNDGYSMSIHLRQDYSAAVGLFGVNVVEGRQYDVIVIASNGQRGVWTGTGFDAHSVIFPGLDKNSIHALANARKLRLGALGSFDLTDSKAAMLKIVECVEALRSTL